MSKNSQNTYKSKKKKENQRRGKRNRQRGAELQRQAVNLAKNYKLEAFNRDRGGAQHEMGDVEIDGKYYGCKRRKSIAAWVKPEKQEVCVVIREDRGEPFMVVPLEHYLFLVAMAKEKI